MGLLPTTLLVCLLQVELTMGYCTIKNIPKAYDLAKTDVVIYGVRVDGAVMVRLAKDFSVYSDDENMDHWASKSKSAVRYSQYQAFMLRVDDTLQLFVALSTGSPIGVTTLYYVPEFSRRFTNEKQFIFHFEVLAPLTEVGSPVIKRPFYFHDIGEALYGYSSGHSHKLRFYFKLSRNKTTVEIASIKRIKADYGSLDSEYRGNIASVPGGRYKWETKTYAESKKVCIAATTMPFFATAINFRTEQLKLYKLMAEGRAKRNGSIPSFSSDVEAIYKPGDVFIGFWKHALFARRIEEPVPRFGDILNFADIYAGSIPEDGFDENTPVYMFSTTGQETFVVAYDEDTATVYYKLLYTNVIRKSFRHYSLRRSSMQSEKIREADSDARFLGVEFDARTSDLHVYITDETRHRKITIKLNEKGDFESNYELFYNYTPALSDCFIEDRRIPFSNEIDDETTVNFQIRANRVLFRNRNTIYLQMLGSKEKKKLTINAGPMLRWLLFFPAQDVDDIELEKKRMDKFFKQAIFGISGCDLFVANDPNDVVTSGEDCDLKEKIRVFAVDSKLIAIYKYSEYEAHYYTTTVEVPVNSSDFKFQVNLNLLKSQRFYYKSGTFDHIYADREKIYFRKRVKEECPLVFSSILQSTKFKFQSFTIPCSGIYDVENEPRAQVKSVLYDTVDDRLYFVVEMTKRRELRAINRNLNEKYRRNIWEMSGGTLSNELLSLRGSFLTYKTENGTIKIADLTRATDPVIIEARDLRFAGVFQGNIRFIPEIPFRTLLNAEAADEGADIHGFLSPEERNDNFNGSTLPPKPPAFDEGGFAVAEIPQAVICWFFERDFAILLVFKTFAVDLMLFLLLVALLLYHRIKIIPARRRLKIIRGVLRSQQRRAIRYRAKRRLKKLNVFLRRQLKAKEKEDDEEEESSDSSSSEADQVTGVPAISRATFMDSRSAMKPTSITQPPVSGATFVDSLSVTKQRSRSEGK